MKYEYQSSKQEQQYPNSIQSSDLKSVIKYDCYQSTVMI